MWLYSFLAAACTLALVTFLIYSVLTNSKSVAAFVQLGELQRRKEVADELRAERAAAVESPPPPGGGATEPGGGATEPVVAPPPARAVSPANVGRCFLARACVCACVRVCTCARTVRGCTSTLFSRPALPHSRPPRSWTLP